LKDKLLNYQIINLTEAEVKFSNGYFYVSNTKKGTKYNDTCLSELNLLLKNGSFVFGDLDD
jgi:hypothetical protein